MKAFFAKIWAWVLANKVISAIIAGATVAVLTVAIVVPVSVSAAKKKKAAQEQETHETTPGGNSGSQSGDQGGSQNGGQQGGGQAAHEHKWSVAWTSDATSHWHACSGCTDKKDEANHTVDPNGFCSVCNRYLGDEFAFVGQVGGYLDFVHDQMDMEANQVYLCRISGAISGHMYELEDGDPWSGAPGTNIDSAVSAYTMIDGQPHVVDLSGTVPSEIGSDGYLYIKLDASNLHNRKDVWFRICQLHVNNGYGFCDVTETCEYDEGYSLNLGVNRLIGNKNQNTKVYAHFPYEAGKAYSYKVSCGGGDDWVFKAYRRTGLSTAVEVNLNGADELEAAYGRQLIYIVIDIHTAVTQLFLEVWEGPSAPASWQNIGFKVDRTYTGQQRNLDTAFAEDLFAGASALYDRVPITSGHMYTAYAQATLNPGEEITIKCYTIYNNAAQLLDTYTGTGSNYRFLGEVLSQDGYLYFVAEADNGDPEEAIAVNLKVISVDENYFDSEFRFYGIQGYEADDDTIQFEDTDKHISKGNKYAFAFNAVAGDKYSLGGATLDSSVSYEMYEVHELLGQNTLVKLLDDNGVYTASSDEVFVYISFNRAIGDESFVVHQHHVTNASSYGYCVNDDTFVGEEFSTQHQNTLTLSDDEYHFARFEFKAGHKYEVEYSTNTGYDVAYYLYNGSIWVETTLTTIQVTGVTSAQPYQGTETYLYISFHRTDPTDSIMIDIDIEEIHPANSIGYCDTCDVFTGKTYSLGQKIDLGVMHTGDVAFFKVPLQNDSYHKVTREGDVQTGDCTLIILQPDGGIINSGFDHLKTYHVPDEDGWELIIKVAPTSNFANNGYLTVSLNS